VASCVSLVHRRPAAWERRRAARLLAKCLNCWGPTGPRADRSDGETPCKRLRGRARRIAARHRPWTVQEIDAAQLQRRFDELRRLQVRPPRLPAPPRLTAPKKSNNRGPRATNGFSQRGRGRVPFEDASKSRRPPRQVHLQRTRKKTEGAQGPPFTIPSRCPAATNFKLTADGTQMIRPGALREVVAGKGRAWRPMTAAGGGGPRGRPRRDARKRDDLLESGHRPSAQHGLTARRRVARCSASPRSQDPLYDLSRTAMVRRRRGRRRRHHRPAFAQQVFPTLGHSRSDVLPPHLRKPRPSRRCAPGEVAKRLLRTRRN